MPSQGTYDVLKYARIKRVVKQIQDVRVTKPVLRFLQRTPIVPALDSELLARYVGHIKIADLVADDSPANVHTTGKMRFEGVTSPNIKHGVTMGQAQLNELYSLTEADFMDEDGTFRQWMRMTINGLMEGIDQRKESIIIAGMIDDFDYNRFGVVIEEGRFGMPSDLKVTVSPGWANVASPAVTDIWRIKRVGEERYGVNFNRMTLGSQAFQYLIQTTEFQTYVKQMGLISLTMPTGDQLLNVNNRRLFIQLAIPILGLDEIEIYTGRAWNQDQYGVWRSEPLLPLNKVIFTDTSDDNNRGSYDFSSGILTESIVNSVLRANGVAGGIIGGIDKPTRGPINYVTPTTFDANPAGLTWWGVDRGWFRRHRQQCSAVFDIGSVTEDFPITDIDLS